MYVTWTDLGLAVLFMFGIVLCVYLIMLIRNLNASVSIIKRILDENEDSINQTLKDIPAVTKNMIEISDTAKNELKTVGAAINSITETVEMTAATVSTFKSDFMGKIRVIVDFIDVIRKLITKEKK